MTWMKWTLADAISIALDMRFSGEIGVDQFPETVNTLWAEMEAENESENA